MKTTRNNVPWINLVVGILAIVSPWVTGPIAGGSAWDVTITGIVIALIAIISLGVGARSGRNVWPAVNIVAGAYLIVSVVFTHGDVAVTWSNVALGAIAIVTALVSLSYERAGASRESGTYHGGGTIATSR